MRVKKAVHRKSSNLLHVLACAFLVFFALMIAFVLPAFVLEDKDLTKEATARYEHLSNFVKNNSPLEEDSQEDAEENHDFLFSDADVREVIKYAEEESLQDRLLKNNPLGIHDGTSKEHTTIAYAVVLTDCSIGDGLIPFQIAEGAAILRHAIHQNSIQNPHSKSQYDYKLYAIFHPDAAACAPKLESFGFELVERDVPVPVESIKGDFLRSRIHSNGCCGERELIKLEAFTLTQHSLVVLLDLDVLILKPLDYLFDLMLKGATPPYDHLMPSVETIPDQIDLLYTTDYAMVSPGRKVKPAQGGFVVLRPSQETYTEFVDIIQEGDFRDNGGWGGSTGKFWGAMTFQGLIPYYFLVLHPGRSVELNWCIYDNMCSPSRDGGVDEYDRPTGKCFTNADECEDCRDRPFEDVYLFHFTVCQKPWTCQRHEANEIQHRLCRTMHHVWFQMRSEMEKSWGRHGRGSGDFYPEHFLGYCNRHGQKGYLQIEEPYGKPLDNEKDMAMNE